MIGNIADLEKSLKLDEGSLQKALDNEETVSIEIPTLVIRTPEEDELRTDNLKKEYHTAGLEIAIKNVRNDLNLEFTGKNMPNLLEAYKSQVLKDAAVEPNEKNKELQGDLEKVQSAFRVQTEEFDQFKTDAKAAQSKTLINDQIMGSMDGDYTLSKVDMLTLFNAKHSTQYNEDGNLEFSQNGNVMKNDTTRSLLSASEVVSAFANDFIKKTQGPSGAGGTDETGAGANSMEKFTKEMIADGKAPGSEPYNIEMQKRMKEGTLKL